MRQHQQVRTLTPLKLNKQQSVVYKRVTFLQHMNKLIDRFGKLLFYACLIAGLTVGLQSSDIAEAKTPVKVSAASNGNLNTLNASAVVDAPPAVVWKAMTDYNKLASIIPSYKKSRVINNTGGSKTVDMALKVNTFLPTYNYKVNVQENPQAHRLTLKRVSGDFKSLNASYKLQALNGGKQTMILYKLAIDPGNNIPGTRKILTNNTKNSLEALQSHVERAYRNSIIGNR